MKHIIFIERWQRQICEISLNADHILDAQNKALELYFNNHLEDEFKECEPEEKFKNETITVYDNETASSLKMPINQYKGIQMKEKSYLLQLKYDDYCYCDHTIKAYSLDDARIQAEALYKSGELNQKKFVVVITEKLDESH